VDAVGLTEKNIRAAENYGAQIRTGTRVKGLMRKDGNTVCGVAAVSESGSTSEFSAKIVINASGPWVDEISKMAGVRTDLRLRKGTHLVYDRRLVEHGLLLEAADRERYIFVVPFKNGTLVGPTDLSSAGTADELKADESEIRYLLDSVKRYLPDFPEDYASTRTGARPILGQTGSEKLLSREYEIHDHAEDGVEGFLTIAGGKMSDFRLMAKDAVDLACRKIDSKKKCETHCLTLSGERLENIPAFARPGKRLKRFMRKNPRLRELYSLAWLGAGLIRHTLSRIFFGTREISADQFRKHYATGEKV